MNAGRQFKQGFNMLLRQFGGTILVHKRYGTQAQTTTEHRGMKNNEKNAPNKVIFQFPEKVKIENGDVLQQEGASDLWEVYETEDQVVSGIYIHFDAFVQKRDGSLGRIKERLPSVHIGGDNLGGIQIGTKRSTQTVNVTVSPFLPELEALRDIVDDATDIDELDKEEVKLALDRVEELSKREEKAPSLLKRMNEKLDFVKTSVALSEKAAAAAPYIASIFEKIQWP